MQVSAYLKLSVAVALATIALKTAAWWVTGSVSLLSDALESLVNLAGASFALLMVSIAAHPADDHHPYGHHKAEYFSSGFEGVLILAAALAIIAAALQRLWTPQPLQSLGWGLGLSLLSTAMNGALAWAMLRKAREHRSIALEGDARHLFADVWTSLGVVFGLLAAGESTLCYDGQNFFDTDHPVYPNVDGTGTATLVSNYDNGGTSPGPAWYLLDTSRALKPLIFQERTTPELEALTSTQDEMVFMSDAYRYGIRYRCNAGFGFWQLAYKSKAALDAANFNAAMAAMMQFRADGGRPLGVRPTHLVVGPSLRADALKLVESLLVGGGDSNPNYKAVQVIVSPWL